MAARSSGPGVDVVLYGGTDGAQELSDTWTFDGTDWTLRQSAGGPTARVDAAMVYHDAIGQFVHFGGTCFGGCFGETSLWDGALWSTVFTPTAPPARRLHAMAYDPIRGETVLFGGELLQPGAGVADDTWVFDGITWTQKFGPRPPQLVSHTMAFDPRRGTVVLHGGRVNGINTSNQTWEWDGSQWTRVSGPNMFPDFDHAIAFDGNNNQLIAFRSTIVPSMLEMIWEPEAVIQPVVGTVSGAYPCPLSFGIVVSSPGVRTYTWFKDGSVLFNGNGVSGVNTATLTINPSDASTAGAYFCRVLGNCGFVDSGTITVDMRCLADVNMNGVAEPGDFNAWVLAFNLNDAAADQNCDGLITPADFNAWVLNYNAGC